MNGLKNKLARLYTASGIAILLIIFLAVGIIIYENGMNALIDDMGERMNRYLDILNKQNHIADSFLKDEEQYSECAIFIFDNKTPFRFEGGFLTGKERENLLLKCLNTENTSWTKIRSDGIRYLMYKDETADKNINVYLCRDLNRFYRSFYVQAWVLSACFLSGSAALFALGRLLAGWAIRPVEENQKEQLAFVHGAGHELRSPLAVIRSNNAAAGVDRENDSHYRQIIDDECQRMGHLVEELLALAAGGTRGIDTKEETFFLDTFIIECYEKFEPLCREKGIPLSVSLPDGKGEGIKADKQRLEQVVGIIMENAFSYGASPQGIELELEETKKWIAVSVKDHGPGVPYDQREEIFRRFYRSDKSRKDKEHFGLGLSIAKEIVEAMGGRIEVGDTPGGGAKFRIRLNKK